MMVGGRNLFGLNVFFKMQIQTRKNEFVKLYGTIYTLLPIK